MSSIFSDHGIRAFQVDRRIVKTGALAQLSGDALRLYLMLNYEFFTARKMSATLPDARLRHELGLRVPQIRSAAGELQLAGLIVYEQDVDRTTFAIAPLETQ